MSRRGALVALLLSSCVATWPDGASAATPSRGRSIDVFILAGQSNMQGYAGDAGRYPADPWLADLRVKFFYARSPGTRAPDTADAAQAATSPWYETWAKHLKRRLASIIGGLRRVAGIPPRPAPSDQWTTLGPQWGRFQPYGHFGPEITFARGLLEVGMSPAIFKYARSSTSLAEDWRKPGDGGLYDDMVARLGLALSALRRSGLEPRLRGVVWIQGESDGKDEDSARTYGGRLELLIEHLRSDVAGWDVPVILGAYERNPALRKRPEVIAAQERLAVQLRCVARSSMEGLEAADWTHLSPEGIAAHGRRLFEAYRALPPSCKVP